MVVNEVLVVIVSLALSLPGIAALYIHWQERLKQKYENPNVYETYNKVTADLLNRVRDLENSRCADHKLILELSTRIELWKEYSRVLVVLLNQLGVKDIPAPPSDEHAYDDVVIAIDRAKLQRRIAERFNIEEINDLSFQIGIDPEQLAGEVKIQRATSLVQAAGDRDLLEELIELAQARRPRGEWK